MPIINSNKQTTDGVVIMSFSTKNLHQMADAVKRQVYIILLILTILVLLGALLYSTLLARPLKQITSSINEISQGDMSVKLNMHGFSEISSISDSFNQRMTKIINDLLSMVKMDKNTSQVEVVNTSINDLLEQLLKRLRPIAAERNIELIYESYRPVMADIDETKMSIALNNLIENAIKYNYDDGWVRVTLNADHKFFYVTVQDSGVGIPEDVQDNVFERFYRVDKARSRDTGGTGLGLSLTRSAVLLHRGSIKLYSKEKEGTTFTVRIPLTYVP